MSNTTITTERLILELSSPEELCEMLAQMPPEALAQMSADWLAQAEAATEPDPWLHGFAVMLREGQRVGDVGFKGRPVDGMVEIAYQIEPDHQGNGYATEAAAAATAFALGDDVITVVCAHTLPETNASTRVLEKCGFEKRGEVMDPDDGRVWRWEKR